MAAGRPHPNPETVPCLLRAWHHDEIEAFLSARVPENLFQLCWIENRGVQPLRDPDLFHFRGLRGEDGRLRGVCLVIADQLALLDTRGEEAARRLGRWYRENGLDFEHVVSARRCVEPFWKGYARAGRHRLEAELNRIQTMYIFRSRDWLDRPAVDGESPDPTPLRYARRGDLDALLEASVAMHREETHRDPLNRRPEAFREHVTRRIESNRSLVWFDRSGVLKFKADISARGHRGVQISGVYTAPDFRGRGVATRAMRDACDRLFQEGVPRIVLYVDCDNEPARRVYEKVGFSQHADYQTVFVGARD